MDAAACIGCGACVAACKNASAMLFVSAKVSHLGLLLKDSRSAKEGRSIWFSRWMPRASAIVPITESGSCMSEGIGVKFIAKLNRDYLAGSLKARNKKCKNEVAVEFKLRYSTHRSGYPWNSGTSRPSEPAQSIGNQALCAGALLG